MGSMVVTRTPLSDPWRIDAAFDALDRGMSPRAAAREAGVSEQTVRRWARHEERVRRRPPGPPPPPNRAELLELVRASAPSPRRRLRGPSYARSIVESVLRQAGAGVPHRAIARAEGLSPSTVRAWVRAPDLALGLARETGLRRGEWGAP